MIMDDRLKPPTSTPNGFVALVVDHDPVSRHQLRGLLENDGACVIEAGDLSAATDALRQHPPTIVLLDLTRANTDFSAFCAQVPALTDTPAVPVLAITALDDEESINLALAAGASDYVTKPIRPAVLHHRVQRLVQVHRTDAAILRAKREWEAAFDAVSDMVILTDLNGRIIRCNYATIQRLQTTYTKLIGCNLNHDLWNNTEHELPLPFGEPLETELCSLAGWFEARSFPGRLEGRLDTIVYVLKDITERKQLQENLRESEQRFRALVENISEGIELFDSEARVLYASPGVARILGVPSNTDFLGINPMANIHPDDVERNWALFGELLQQPGNSFTTEIRSKHANGSWLWLEASARNMLGEDGINAVLVNFRDITERKNDEMRLRQLSQAVEQSPISIVITDTAGKIEHVNPRFTQLTGYTFAEAIGQTPRILKSERTPPETHTQMWNTITAGHEWEGEFINKKKNGEIFIEKASISPVIDEKGVITHFLALKEDITERKKLEESLRQNEKRFRAMIENSADAIALIDAQGTITYITSAITSISGYAPDQYLGHSAFEFMHAEDLPPMLAGFKKLVQIPGRVTEGLFRSPHIDGSWRWVSTTSSNQFADPAVQAIIINFRDVTERKQAEEALHASEARYRSLFEDSPVALWEEDFSEVKSFLDRLRAEENVTDFEAYFQAHPEVVNECAAKVIVKDVNRAAVKLLAASSKEELLGSLNSILSAGAHNTFHEELISIASGCTHCTFERPNRAMNGEIRHVSVLWSVWPGYEDALSKVTVSIVDLTERKRAEELLRQAEEHLRLIVETVQIPILISSASEGTILFANTALGEVVGLSPQELLGQRTPDFYVNPADRQMLLETLNREGKLHNYELAIKNVDQTPLWVLVSMHPLMFAGQPALLAALYDVTERKRAEAALAESEQRFRQFFAASPDALVVIDPSDPVDWVIVDCNETACQMNGYTREEMIGQSIDLLNGTVGSASERAAYLERLRQDGIVHLESIHRHKDGRLFPVEISTTLFTLGGRELILGIDRDITQRKQAEEALRLSEERFQWVSYATNDAVWDLDLTTGQRWWNAGVRTLFGYKTDQIGSNQDWWERQIHPDDRSKVLASFRAALASDGQFWSKEYRYRKADGSYAYVFDRGYVMQDQDGHPVRAIGAMTDLTERKQFEDTLRKREQQLAEAQQTAHLGSWEWDFHTHEVVWSDEMYRLCGWEPGSIIPGYDGFSALIHPEDRDCAMEHVGQAFQNHEPYDFDYRIIPAKGEILWLHGHGEFLKDETGQPVRFRGTAQDITERKQAEETLRASQAALSEALQIAHLGSWEWDFPTNTTVWSDQLCQLYGLDPGTHTPSLESFIALTHPEDRNKVGPIIRQSLQTHQPFDLDYRIISAQGEIRWMHGHGEFLKDETGEYVRLRGTAQDITERKQAEETLRASQGQLSEALQIAKLAYWEYDIPNDEFIFNDHFYAIFHTTASQEGGYRMSSAHYAQKFCHPEDMAVVGAEIEKALNSTERHYHTQLDHRILYADGGTGYISVRINIDRDEEGQILRYYGANQDITERKRMEEALMESQEVFSKAFHASPAPMGISRVDNGRIIDVNGAWERLFGYERETVMGRSILDLSIYANPQDRAALVQQVHELGKVIDYEVKVKTKEDEELILLISAQIVEIRDQACLMSAFYDISELRRMHEAMLASQKLADLGTLAAGVAHEMNSPLQVITGVSQSLFRKAENNTLEPEQMKRNLDVIHRNGWRCAEIVRSLHTYARNSGGLMEPAGLNELVKDSLLLIEHQLKSWANISVRTSLAEDLSALICDRNQITQVLINLLTNARDAMPEGGEITIVTAQDLKSDQLILQVSDTGKGIPDSIRNKIFDPFFTTKPLGKGTGLGLSIVAGIVRAHGGAIAISSTLPQGTTFTVRFPTKPPQLPASEAVDTPGRFDNTANAHGSTTEQIHSIKEYAND